MKSLAEMALKTVRESRTSFVPERYAHIYCNWLENIQDWCISRQIWWGHRIPVYYYDLEDGSKGSFASLDGTPPQGLKAKNIRQDEDVLDTWFSSALWPFVTMQDDAKVFEHFYPTSILATAREIINLWVSRMIYSSEYFEHKEPFKHVLIHPVVQTPDGKRMSKSKGNAIDPLELVEAYGADASRMWYASVGVLGPQDVRFPGQQDKTTKKWSSDTLEQYRKFANKLFNAARFVTMQLGDGFKPEPIAKLNTANLRAPDIWILSKFNGLLKSLETDYANYDLGAVQSKIYDFIWFSFCDWYIEFSKIDTSVEQKQILYYILESSLRLLHPIMPCITEDIWQDLRKAYGIAPDIIRKDLAAERQASISFASYPTCDGMGILRFAQDDGDQAAQVEYLTEVISALRNARQTLSISWSNLIELYVDAADFECESILKSESYIKSIAKVSKIVTSTSDLAKPASTIVIRNAKIQIPLAGLVDLAKLRENVDRKIANLLKDIKGLEQRLGSENFIKNASPEKVVETKEALGKLLLEKTVYDQEMLALS
jgi:valyl-tRNA synthetase